MRMSMRMSSLMTVAMVAVVVIMSWSLMQNINENEVEDQAEYCRDEHDITFDIVINEYSFNSLYEQVDCYEEKEED